MCHLASNDSNSYPSSAIILIPSSYYLFKIKKWLLQSWYVPNIHTLGQLKSENSCFLMEGPSVMTILPNNEDHNLASIDASRLNELDFESN